MSLFGNALQNILKQPNLERPPAAVMSGMYSGSVAAPTSGGVMQQLQAYNGTGWLHAVVDRIATSIAATEWNLYRTTSNGDRQELFMHPLLQLWKSINPYDSQQTLMEMTQQHLELTGEAWWILLRNGAGVPQEIWCVRPDRMKIVPSREDFIAGYIYELGSEKIPLERQDVIFIKNPNPLDPYRGAGVVQSILTDLDSERMATAYTRNFFRNSAQPNGIIQFDEDLSDADFDRLVERWREQHQGVGNANRVAVLERGKWVDRKGSTQRDMQFEQLRRLNRDTILGAFGVPSSIMGITESVNRANAEAGEVQFARWVLRPRLVRIKSALNEFLVPLFGTDLEFDFIDPTPENREFNLTEATTAFTAGLLTKNEARLRLGEGEVDNGDEFKNGDNPVSDYVEPEEEMNPEEPEENNPSYDEEERSYIKQIARGDGFNPPEIEKQEQKIYQNWTKRLKKEVQLIIEFLEENNKQLKLEGSDAAYYPWESWHANYVDEVAEELSVVLNSSMMIQEPLLPKPIAQQMAIEAAREQADKALSFEFAFDQYGKPTNIVGVAAQRMQLAVARTIERGETLQTLRKNLETDIGFSPARAARIARTETARAIGTGKQNAALATNKDQKQWVTQGDDLVDFDGEGPCVSNEAQGWIGIGQAFIGGDLPAHPNCRCTVIYRTKELHETIEEAQVELPNQKALPSNYREVGYAAEVRCGSCRFYWDGHCEYWHDSVGNNYVCNSWLDGSHVLIETFCPTCQKRLPMNNFTGSADIYCPRCKETSLLMS